jgi:cytochrome c peroxidase
VNPRLQAIITSLFTLLVVSFGIYPTYQFNVPAGWPKPVYTFKNNPLTTEGIYMGRVLFFDSRLSENNTISCASCHSSYNAFAHTDHALSHGIYDSIGTRNAPALFNLAWQRQFMWDGAIHHLDAQALAPISNPIEMNENIQHVVEKLQHDQAYRALCYSAYGDSMITGERILKCLSQFMLTLVSANSKYDSVKAGKSAFTAKEQKGYAIYKKKCSACHTEPLFSNYAFRSNGLPADSLLKDIGRERISMNKADQYLFKVPSLRNLEYSYPYMHDGRYRKLRDVIDYYNHINTNTPFLSTELKEPLNLSAEEIVELLSFLLTLNDKTFVFNPDFTYPKSFPYPKK